MFDASGTSGGALPAATRSAIVNAAGVGADRIRFDRLLAALQSTDSEEDRWIYAHALASVRDEKLATALLATTIVPGRASNVVTTNPRHDGRAVTAWSTGVPIHARSLANAGRARRRYVPRPLAAFAECRRFVQ